MKIKKCLDNSIKLNEMKTFQKKNNDKFHIHWNSMRGQKNYEKNNRFQT